MKLLFVLLFSYLLGSIPIGLLVAKFKGIDIRRYGSGNIGATNVFRILGTGPGLIVLIGDMIKGIIAVWVGGAIEGPNLALIAGLTAIAGHSWSIFLNFSGGKGVATAGGVLLALAPGVVAVALAVWVTIVVLFRYVSLASIIAAITVPFLMALFGKPWSLFGFGVLAAVLVIYRHKPNIKRLLAGKELKIGDNTR
ncbi:MAG: glycerol-3-phosphate 1-O-acyltransferase PlsY [Syntrophomonadaceae bacterium]|jgi:glycerol-3-phosphate acyltransferase PlsY|nr:glycerol-3-phosphate 1-O-acyltransferase PlsY [Syntrophomonadaceae bacterium]